MPSYFSQVKYNDLYIKYKMIIILQQFLLFNIFNIKCLAWSMAWSMILINFSIIIIKNKKKRTWNQISDEINVEVWGNQEGR